MSYEKEAKSIIKKAKKLKIPQELSKRVAHETLEHILDKDPLKGFNPRNIQEIREKITESDSEKQMEYKVIKILKEIL